MTSELDGQRPESTKGNLGNQYDYSVQAFTQCENCHEMQWTVMRDDGKELCRKCYVK